MLTNEQKLRNVLKEIVKRKGAFINGEDSCCNLCGEEIPSAYSDEGHAKNCLYLHILTVINENTQGED